MARVIFHLDLDAFFCAVEEQLNPQLIGKPFAVGGKPDQRGVVASCSYAARQFGVRSAMPMSQAIRLCPQLIITPQKFDHYRRASRSVMDYLHTLTPLVEQISIDEAFLDITGIRGAGESLAQAVQKHIHDELSLPCSLGVASNKLVAKIANTIGKSQAAAANPGNTPNAITLIPDGQEAQFLAPLSIRELWGIGPKTAEKLNTTEIYTIGDLAQLSQRELIQRFGKHGGELYFRARGMDNRPVEPEHDTKSIRKETTFARDVRDAEQLRQTLRHLADGVGRQVRKQSLMGKTVSLKLRWSDFTTITRQTTLPHPINQDDEIYENVLSIFEDTWTKGKPVRLIGVGISGFEDTQRQLSLWDKPKSEENRRLQSTLDELKNRFGDNAIKRGSDFD